MGRDFPHLSRQALVPTQPPMQQVLGLISRGKTAGAVIPFHVSQLKYLQGQTLGVMEILFSKFCAGFAKNVPSDERLHAP